MLLTITRYRAITGDTATESVAVSAAIEEAEELLAEELLGDTLDRELEEAERTETLWPTRDGYLWPTCVPIVAAANYTIDGDGLVGTFGPGWPNESGSVAVLYTGGWVERSANPTATNRLPAYIERDLAFAAHALTAPSPNQYPAGATSVRLGDAAVTFGPDGAPRPGADAVRWSRATLRHRARTTRGAGGRC
jgi:hypothetical protein